MSLFSPRSFHQCGALCIHLTTYVVTLANCHLACALIQYIFWIRAHIQCPNDTIVQRCIFTAAIRINFHVQLYNGITPAGNQNFRLCCTATVFFSNVKTFQRWTANSKETAQPLKTGRNGSLPDRTVYCSAAAYRHITGLIFQC